MLFRSEVQIESGGGGVGPRGGCNGRDEDGPEVDASKKNDRDEDGPEVDATGENCGDEDDPDVDATGAENALDDDDPGPEVDAPAEENVWNWEAIPAESASAPFISRTGTRLGSFSFFFPDLFFLGAVGSGK